MRASNAAIQATNKANVSHLEGDHLAAIKLHETAAAAAETAAGQLRHSGDIEKALERAAVVRFHHSCIGTHKQEALESVELGRTADGTLPHDQILEGAARLRLERPEQFKTDAAAVDAFVHTAAGKAAYEHYRDCIVVGDRRLPLTH
jgi:hypothetical protein